MPLRITSAGLLFLSVFLAGDATSLGSPLNASSSGDSLNRPARTAGTPRSRSPHRRSSRPRWRWNGNSYLRGYYDDNILDYSRRDRDLFTSRAHPNKFSILSADDWITDVGAFVERRRGAKSRREYRLRLSGNGHWYARNVIKNWLDYDLEGRWASPRRALIAHVGWTPHFYLRDLLLRDTANPHPATPSYARAGYHSWTGDLEYRLRQGLPAEQRLAAGWKRTSYNRAFNERNSTTWWGSYGWVMPIHDRWEASWDYRYSHFGADGARQADAVIDVSHHEHEWEAGLQYQSKSSWTVGIDVAYQLELYTSQKPADPYHVGRRDHEWRLQSEVRIPAGGGWQIRLLEHWTQATSNRPETSDFGAYNDNQFGARLARSW
ncbi:MAG: hypothetical protein HY304_08060 [candidate division Zixibacteria bacterium]|nr:hypothetical protein [candidate division Zixibacteria bacterium]